ncbi:hypothetical protein H4R35_006322 [Dimargaris xerosporica]|nr:hypothetical protein H4R35_006322 [Dimargaris xerosporica]
MATSTSASPQKPNEVNPSMQQQLPQVPVGFLGASKLGHHQGSNDAISDIIRDHLALHNLHPQTFSRLQHDGVDADLLSLVISLNGPLKHEDPAVPIVARELQLLLHPSHPTDANQPELTWTLYAFLVVRIRDVIHPQQHPMLHSMLATKAEALSSKVNKDLNRQARAAADFDLYLGELGYIQPQMRHESLTRFVYAVLLSLFLVPANEQRIIEYLREAPNNKGTSRDALAHMLRTHVFTPMNQQAKQTHSAYVTGIVGRISQAVNRPILMPEAMPNIFTSNQSPMPGHRGQTIPLPMP